MSRRWTAEEDIVLRRHARSRAPWAACVRELPDRTLLAVYKRASLLGLTDPSQGVTTPRLHVGQVVGNFHVLEIQKRATGGWQYLVQDNRCYHKSLVQDGTPKQPFIGAKVQCGCPLKILHAGYVFWKWHKNGREVKVAEHRIIMEQMLGREMLPSENVHHKNGNKTDNTPSNLELWVSSQPSGQRVDDLLAWAHEIISRYS